MFLNPSVINDLDLQVTLGLIKQWLSTLCRPAWANSSYTCTYGHGQSSRQILTRVFFLKTKDLQGFIQRLKKPTEGLLNGTEKSIHLYNDQRVSLFSTEQSHLPPAFLLHGQFKRAGMRIRITCSCQKEVAGQNL